MEYAWPKWNLIEKEVYLPRKIFNFKLRKMYLKRMFGAFCYTDMKYGLLQKK